MKFILHCRENGRNWYLASHGWIKHRARAIRFGNREEAEAARDVWFKQKPGNSCTVLESCRP